MSDRFSTWIQIGGKIESSHLQELLEAIRVAEVQLNWGEGNFEPNDVAELLTARRDGVLHLCDVEARSGEFPELEEDCRRLGLSYRRGSEGYGGYDASLVNWRPGMKDPIYQRSSNEHPYDALILACEVAPVLTALRAGKFKQAIALLEALLPTIPTLPPFEIV